jgi:hypothetical protein
MYNEPVMAVGILKSLPSKHASPAASTLSLGKSHWTWISSRNLSELQLPEALKYQ